MKEEVFEYLIDYGFNKEDLEEFLKINDKLFFANLDNIKNNINFFKDKELTKDEIINIIKEECFLLTISNKKKELLDNIYYNIFNKDELKNLIITYPPSYVVNPLELEEIINYIKDLGYNIKSIIINNKDLLSYDIEDVKKIIYGE